MIHYCWFGNGEKSKLVKDCIESWKAVYPDYKLIEWNETNFDIDCLQYIKDAYADKKWAFVSDYARLHIIYHNGGVYLDTDVLMKQNCLDEWCKHSCWFASDNIRSINTGMGFGAEKGHHIVGALMDAYKDYIYPNGTNVQRDTLILEKILPNWVKSNENQVIDDVLIVGMNGYGRYAQHLYACSWVDDISKQKFEVPKPLTKWQQFKCDFKWNLHQKLRNPKVLAWMEKRRGTLIEKIYTTIFFGMLDTGIWHYIKLLFKKIFKIFKKN